MVTYEQISAAVVAVMRRSKVNDMDSKTIHGRLKLQSPVSMQRLGVVLARMCRDGVVRSCGKKHALTFRLPDLSETETQLSEGMK